MFKYVVREIVAQPAAGADFTFTPANGEHFKPIVLTAKLVTSAAAANRLPAIVIKGQSGNTYWSADCGVVQTASLTIIYSWSKGGGGTVPSALVGGEHVSLALPDVWLLPGDTVSSLTANIQAGDQWSLVAYRGIVTDEWDEERAALAVAQAIAGYGG